MANFDMYMDYQINKGPLSDQEILLKDLLLRENYYSAGYAAKAAAQTDNIVNTPPIVADRDAADLPLLETVVPGELITAAYMNTIVRTVNDILVYLARQTRDTQDSPTYRPSTPSTKPGAGIAGALKDVEIAYAEGSDDMTFSFPADRAAPSDFADIMVGNQRIDPSDLVKDGDRFSFTINRNSYSDGMAVRAVSQGGTAAQQVLSLLQ